ncbi:MAG TPA: GNAT family N-acetyltransferase [Actinomycetes bacterium]|nr:GNAT family N-acetyltransferase [Actinomycetes bacterium]
MSSDLASSDPAPVRLPDGAIVRAAARADVPAMVRLEADREGEDDAVDLQLVADTPGGLESMSVVERDGRIVSIATLLDETLTVGSTTLPAGQIEMVATARDAEGRGYVRALMNRSHALSAARGHVVQVMIGIPHFYRQFGYAYSIRMHPWATVRKELPTPEGYTTSVATPDDIATCQQLQDHAQAAFDVTMPHSDDCWKWLTTHTSSKQVFAVTPDATPVGLARVYDDGEGSVDLGEIASSDEDATRTLLAYGLDAAGPDGTVRVNDRPHVPGLSDQLENAERAEWYYVRIEDPALLLQALSPELISRARSSGRDDGEALLSFYRSHVRMTWSAQGVEVTTGGPLQAPVWAGGSGVPLDALGTLVFGDGAEVLEDRWPDALLGKQRELMHILFPPQTADLLTFYLPS